MFLKHVKEGLKNKYIFDKINEDDEYVIQINYLLSNI